MEKMDYKKAYKDLYLPKTKPALIQVPPMIFIQVQGSGNPNTSPLYKEAMEILYGLSYSIKMSKMDGSQPEGYFEYVVPPLEGLWWMKDGGTVDYHNKEDFCWISMIRQPEFVNAAVFEAAKEKLLKKKPGLNMDNTRLVEWTEGLCAQVMHLGPYDDEPQTLKRLNAFIETSGYVPDFSDMRRHHEIYLGDPRKTAPERLKTVLRLPVKAAGEFDL